MFLIIVILITIFNYFLYIKYSTSFLLFNDRNTEKFPSTHLTEVETFFNQIIFLRLNTLPF